MNEEPQQKYSRKINKSVIPPSATARPKKLNLPIGFNTTIYDDNPQTDPSMTARSRQSRKKDKLSIAQKRAKINNLVK
tara:strand:+ start:236 stop:469 length:234 start_codon:yes stop_codon:yes gene_type:complete